MVSHSRPTHRPRPSWGRPRGWLQVMGLVALMMPGGAVAADNLQASGQALSAQNLRGPDPHLERDYLVVLDPGHGGSNHGCAGSVGALQEKTITLELALELEARVEELLPHARVELTRRGDQTLTLAERVEQANALGADLFISLHANASASGEQHGYETYLLDLESSTLDAALTAARVNGRTSRENAPQKGSSASAAVGRMLGDLHQRSHRKHAAIFARSVQGELGERFPERRDGGVLQGPFDVLQGAQMPAVLHELGYMDHADEGLLFLDPAARTDMVEALAAAVVDYYRRVVRVEQ